VNYNNFHYNKYYKWWFCWDFMELVDLLPLGVSIRFRSLIRPQERIIRKNIREIREEINFLSPEGTVNWPKYSSLKENLIKRTKRYTGKYKKYFENQLEKVERIEDIVSSKGLSEMNYGF